MHVRQSGHWGLAELFQGNLVGACALAVLPSATQTLRKRPRRLVRIMGVPRNFCLNPSSSSSSTQQIGLMQSLEVDGFHTFFPSRNNSREQTSGQSSQPKTRSPISGRISMGMEPVFDGPVRDAATCVQFEGFGDRLGRASLKQRAQ